MKCCAYCKFNCDFIPEYDASQCSICANYDEFVSNTMTAPPETSEHVLVMTADGIVATGWYQNGVWSVYGCPDAKVVKWQVMPDWA